MSRCRSFAAAMAVLLLAAPLAARGVSAQGESQETTPTVALTVAAAAPADSTPLPALGPTRGNAIAGVHVVAATSRPSRALASPQHSSSTAMMIVGGSAMIVGAVVGGRAGTIVMVGGGILGLVGLWKYLN